MSAKSSEPDAAMLSALQLTAGALQCVAQMLPEGDKHVIHFTGEWSHLGSLPIWNILDLANGVLETDKEG